MERIVIAAYKPLPGKLAELESLIKSHWQILKDQDLVSDRKSIIMQAEDGTILEVFGWKSKLAMEAAHKNAAVLEMWQEYASVCEYISVDKVPEATELFSEFTPIN